MTDYHLEHTYCRTIDPNTGKMEDRWQWELAVAARYPTRYGDDTAYDDVVMEFDTLVELEMFAAKLLKDVQDRMFITRIQTAIQKGPVKKVKA